MGRASREFALSYRRIRALARGLGVRGKYRRPPCSNPAGLPLDNVQGLSSGSFGCNTSSGVGSAKCSVNWSVMSWCGTRSAAQLTCGPNCGGSGPKSFSTCTPAGQGAASDGKPQATWTMCSLVCLRKLSSQSSSLRSWTSLAGPDGIKHNLSSKAATTCEFRRGGRSRLADVCTMFMPGWAAHGTCSSGRNLNFTHEDGKRNAVGANLSFMATMLLQQPTPRNREPS